MIAAIFAAFPQELKHIRKLPAARRNTTDRPFPSPGKEQHCTIMAVETGMGARGTESAFCRFIQERRPDIIVSAGFCGALYENARVGDIVWSTRAHLFGREIMHPHDHPVEDDIPGYDLSRRIRVKLRDVAGAREGSIVTLTEIMEKSIVKDMIPRELPFPVCDMESFYLARFSHQNHVPFLAMRAITDRLDEDVPRELLAVTDETGRYRFSRALGLLLANPTLFPAGARLGRDAAKASKCLGKAVGSLMDILSDLQPEHKAQKESLANQPTEDHLP